MRLFSIKEINDYATVKEQNKELAIEVNRALGLYYADVTGEVETYIAPWLALGFSADTIKMLAKFCFRCRIQTLEGMDSKIRQLASKGCISATAITDYVEGVLRTDGQIAKVLDVLGLNRNVCANDRKNFKLWMSWGLPFDEIYSVAEACACSFNPMATLNKTLADLKQNGIFTVEKAKEFLANQASTAQTTATVSQKTDKKRNEFLDSCDREYSTEQLFAMFEDLKEDL